MLEPWLLSAAISAATTAAGTPPEQALSPQIDVYTMGPGDHLFERFGHAAICVVYEATTSPSRCYNYGTTDFGSPPAELGWDFLRGTARFWVSVTSPRRMIDQYVAHDRTLFRQRLPLAPDEARAIAARLARDARRENRYYLYHHFDDNCSTRVRDIIDRATGERLSRASAEGVTPSYRVLGKRALADETWASFFGDLLVGRRADERPSRYQAMFLPDYLRSEIDGRFGAKAELLYLRRGRELGGDAPASWPWFVLLAMVVAFPVALFTSLGRPRLGIGMAGALLGVVGALVWLVVGLSQVPELRLNEQMLVFVPFDLLLAVLGERARKAYARLRLAELAAVSACSALGVLRQPLLAAALAPLAVNLLALFSPGVGRATRAAR